jgi:hypothetical protein
MHHRSQDKENRQLTKWGFRPVAGQLGIAIHRNPTFEWDLQLISQRPMSTISLEDATMNTGKRRSKARTLGLIASSIARSSSRRMSSVLSSFERDLSSRAGK